MAKAPILGVQTDAQQFDEAIEKLLGWATDSKGRYVSTCPVYTLMMCREKPEVMQAVNGADMVTADGMPIVWVQRRRGNAQAERVYGPDVMEALLARTTGTTISHYFWGGLPGVADTLVQRMQVQHPTLKVAGVYSPPVSAVGDTPDP